MGRTFLILGGYGNTGFLIAELLLQHSDVQIVLAGRSIERAQRTAHALHRKFQPYRISAIRADAADPKSLRNAFEQVDFVIVASSTSPYVQRVAEAAIGARVDYLDIQLSTVAKIDALKAMEERIEQAGRCFITDGGLIPGVPAALVRYAALQFDRLERANVGCIFRLDWRERRFSDSTRNEMIEEFKNYRPLVLKGGEWVRLGWNDYRPFEFGGEFGRRACAPMFIEEMRDLPEMIPSLQETGFFVRGFNWFVDYIATPAVIGALRSGSKKLVDRAGDLFTWGLGTFSKSPFGTTLVLEASWWKAEERMKMRLALHHKDGYALTAAAVAACLVQYLDGSIKKPGLWLQAHVVDPGRMLRDMKRLGVTVYPSPGDATQSSHAESPNSGCKLTGSR